MWGNVPSLSSLCRDIQPCAAAVPKEAINDLSFKPSLWDLVLKGPSDFGVEIVFLLR